MCQVLVKEERFLYVNSSLHPPPEKTVKDAENKPTPHSKTIYAGIKSGNHRAPKKCRQEGKGQGERREE